LGSSNQDSWERR